MEFEENRKIRLLELCRILEPSSGTELENELNRSISFRFDLKFTDSEGRSLLMLLFLEEVETEEKKKGEEDEELKRNLRKICAEKLLSEDASALVDINQSDRFGENALHYLCRNYKGPGIISLAKLMIRRGIAVDRKSDNGWTAIQYAAKYFDSNRTDEKMSYLLQLLIENGANFKSIDRDGGTLLHSVCSYYQKEDDVIETVKLLLDKNIESGQRNKFGLTALHLSCRSYGKKNLGEVVQCLLERGVDPNMQSMLLGDFILTNNTKPSINEKEFVKQIIQGGANPAMNNHTCLNALHVLCAYYDMENLREIIQLLLDAGVDSNLSTSTGLTALHVLCTQYNKENLREIVQLLLDAGADPNQTARDGWTALHALCRYYNKKNLREIVQLLLDARSEPN